MDAFKVYYNILKNVLALRRTLDYYLIANKIQWIITINDLTKDVNIYSLQNAVIIEITFSNTFTLKKPSIFLLKASEVSTRFELV